MRIDADKLQAYIENRLKVNSLSLENVKGIENLEQEYNWRSVVYKEILAYMKEHSLENIYDNPKLTLQHSIWVIYRFIIPQDVQNLVGKKIVMNNPQVQFLKEETDSEFIGDIEQSRTFKDREEAKQHANSIVKLQHTSDAKVGEIRIELLIEGEKIKLA